MGEPCSSGNDDTISVFPEDVTAVYDHGKRDVISFPYAEGTYYKHKYDHVNIAQYKNIPVPTSYMAYRSDYNFIGEYDYGKQAGLLHVADHHIAPGKKQWTWGCGEFGKAWDLALTDEDGPYIELMTGCFTDNQPDFTWIRPQETKNFKQYFMPYKNIGYVKNATIDAAVNAEYDEAEGQLTVSAYTTSVQKGARILLTLPGENGRQEKVLHEETSDLSPEKTYEVKIDREKLQQIPAYIEGEQNGTEVLCGLRVCVCAADGRELVSYHFRKKLKQKCRNRRRQHHFLKTVKPRRICSSTVYMWNNTGMPLIIPRIIIWRGCVGILPISA